MSKTYGGASSRAILLELFQTIKNDGLIELKLIKIDNKTVSELKRIYGEEQAKFVVNNLFVVNKNYYIDGSSVITDDEHPFLAHFRIDKINKEKKEIKLDIKLSDFKYIKSKRPATYDVHRFPTDFVDTPILLKATFKIVQGDQGEIYATPIQEYLQLQGGTKKITKKQLIERCKSKKIPYSGRTKAELISALR